MGRSDRHIRTAGTDPNVTEPNPRGRWSAELKTALEAAAAAADILTSRSGADQVREKGPADLVTLVDEAAEREIEARIRADYPHDGFVAEEFSASTVSTDRRWIVDPLDGTVNYVHGHPFACVSIALVEGARPIVGVVHAPFLGEVYHAVRGEGAYLNGSRLSVSTVGDPRHALLATGFPFKPGKGDPTVYLQLVGEMLQSTHGIRRAGAAALDLAYVACGRVDAFFEIGLSSWDMAAGILLVLEAGGQVSGWPGDPTPPLDSGRILATNTRIHPWLESVTGDYANRL
jgi:myo-inositol-1(or 4)-monophosphatase